MAPIEKGSVRAEAQPIVQSLAAKGLAGNEALRMLQEQGLGYNRQLFQEDFRLYTGQQKAAEAGKYTRKDRYPGPSSIAPDPRDLTSPYEAMVKLKRVDLVTGEEVPDAWMVIRMDEPMLVGEIESQAWANVEAEMGTTEQMHGNIVVDLDYIYTRQRAG
jgi:hypothetical protein